MNDLNDALLKLEIEKIINKIIDESDWFVTGGEPCTCFRCTHPEEWNKINDAIKYAGFGK